ncbi:MAG TPA: hypothetical protein VJ608_08695 [Albitalea sp.]|nr:hypothetical protein [Albitalea sp.]
MLDHVFSAVLTFCVLAAGTIAMGSALLEQPAAATEQVVQLPRVIVNGKCLPRDATMAQAESVRAVQ